MKVVADLHLHSKYSRAVSPQMIIPKMAEWAKIKGINLLGTGDFTHPLWLSELKSCLEECSQGVFREKTQNPACAEASAGRQNLKLKSGDETKFLLTSEISSIYSQGGKVRKVHTLIIAPSFAVVEKINQTLKGRGFNIISDGRPIIGMSARNLADIVWSIDENSLIIPAHIWTPHFSLFGSNSGFDSIEECFGDLSKYIYAVETGLSSDPGMNWQIKELDNRSILSFSDAHSLANLGREATVLQTKNSKLKTQNPACQSLALAGRQNLKLKINYEDIIGAIKNNEGSDWEVGYTIEFYPEEGKYHYTGHRNCNTVQSPEETKKRGTTCPVCGKPLTVGVMHRVQDLAGSGELGEICAEKDELGVRWFTKEGRPPYVTLVPLAEIIAEANGVGKSSQKVLINYENLINKLGNELKILTEINKERIAEVGGEKLAEGIQRVRSGDIFVKPGFDGEYGKVAVWSLPAEISKGEGINQISLFG